MNAPTRELLATINGDEVGVLRDEANIWSFEYAPGWVESADAFDLAPNLRRAESKIIDGGSQRPAFEIRALYRLPLLLRELMIQQRAQPNGFERLVHHGEAGGADFA